VRAIKAEIRADLDAKNRERSKQIGEAQKAIDAYDQANAKLQAERDALLKLEMKLRDASYTGDMHHLVEQISSTRAVIDVLQQRCDALADAADDADELIHSIVFDSEPDWTDEKLSEAVRERAMERLGIGDEYEPSAGLLAIRFFEHRRRGIVCGTCHGSGVHEKKTCWRCGGYRSYAFR
jgi:DNA repair exonuclease SbcCD ATPase subunit